VARSGTVWTGIAYRHCFGCLEIMGRLKMQDWKMADESAGLEFDGLAMRVKSSKDTVK